jgi:hypothetical protein
MSRPEHQPLGTDPRGVLWREQFDLQELRTLEIALREFMRRKTTEINLFGYCARVHTKISAGLDALAAQEPEVDFDREHPMMR